MYHSITFGNKNTWSDWHLIPTSRPVFNPPQLKEKFVDIPGANGTLDLSTLFSIEPTFQNRVGTVEFVISNDHPWEPVYADMLEHLHGRSMQVALEDDPDHYYEGTFSIQAVNPGAFFSTVTIGYEVTPFKIAVEAG